MGWIGEEWMGALRPPTESVALCESRILGTPKDAKKSPRAIGSGLKWFQNGILLTSSLKRCHMKMLVCMALCYCGAGAEKTAFVREEEAPSVGKGHWRHMPFWQGCGPISAVTQADCFQQKRARGIAGESMSYQGIQVVLDMHEWNHCIDHKSVHRCFNFGLTFKSLSYTIFLWILIMVFIIDIAT